MRIPQPRYAPRPDRRGRVSWGHARLAARAKASGAAAGEVQVGRASVRDVAAAQRRRRAGRHTARGLLFHACAARDAFALRWNGDALSRRGEVRILLDADGVRRTDRMGASRTLITAREDGLETARSRIGGGLCVVAAIPLRGLCIGYGPVRRVRVMSATFGARRRRRGIGRWWGRAAVGHGLATRSGPDDERQGDYDGRAESHREPRF
jgi:hypothetical protein